MPCHIPTLPTISAGERANVFLARGGQGQDRTADLPLSGALSSREHLPGKGSSSPARAHLGAGDTLRITRDYRVACQPGGNSAPNAGYLLLQPRRLCSRYEYGSSDSERRPSELAGGYSEADCPVTSAAPDVSSPAGVPGVPQGGATPGSPARVGHCPGPRQGCPALLARAGAGLCDYRRHHPSAVGTRRPRRARKR